MSISHYYKARKVIEDFIRIDFIGPVENEEIIKGEPPTSVYSAGMLFPQDTEINIVEQVDVLRSGTDENSHRIDNFESDSFDGYEDHLSHSNTFQPSSISLSTTVKPNTDTLDVKINYAIYELIQVTGSEKVEGGEQSREEKIFVQDKWKQCPDEKVIQVNLAIHHDEHVIHEGLELHTYIRKNYSDGSKTLTITLVNMNESNQSFKINNQNTFFQVKLTVFAAEYADVFIEKKMIVELGEDPEVTNLNMLYRHVQNYAIGHGCSVTYELSENGCYMLTTDVIPEYEIHQMKPSVRVSSKTLQMNFLSKGTRTDIQDGLMQLVESYKEWIYEQEIAAEQLESKYKTPAKENISLCDETYNRIVKSIELLSDDQVFFAFQLANRAMYDQRCNFLKQKDRPINPEEITWYPFQLAFFLQEITSIVNPNSYERNLVDLLWFPTGGGKTEAYLGISAFVIFLRRLREDNDKSAGVTILMRYTLRLLTIQQFDRAAALICACEIIRLEENLNGEEISIGLYVGDGLTPNKIGKAEERLSDLMKNGEESVRKGSPRQVLSCPTCGIKIPLDHYEIRNNELNIRCSNKECHFHKGLPIYLIDDDIYKKRPTLVISTVDKFASMTWEAEVSKLFGIDTACPPPELIIQDELHLIAGPLGTITGLYEIAIDRFCYRDGIGAKVIASTATIRNAKGQIEALYGRDFRQFPPQAIDIRDSYFAEESARDDRPARKYFGIMAPGKSAVTTLVRVYACLQFATRYLKDLGFEDHVIDHYWTITGYFNSLRELGGAVVQVYDDVQDRYKYLYKSKFKSIIETFTYKDTQDELVELTSRKNASEIKKALEELSVAYPREDAFDYVLASNMISVGVDIGRLGIMAVTGQPKTNSEYIQASSRVGREFPGLVVTVYNPSKSRDRSHYEQFINYHAAIYKFVEATSLTPFSIQARERALPALFISMCRHLISSMRHNDNAKNFRDDLNGIREIEQFILSRAELLTSSPEEYYETIEHLELIKEKWINKAKETNENLVYKQTSGANNKHPLLKTSKEKDGEFVILYSMRNVDFQSNLYLEEE